MTDLPSHDLLTALLAKRLKVERTNQPGKPGTMILAHADGTVIQKTAVFYATKMGWIEEDSGDETLVVYRTTDKGRAQIKTWALAGLSAN